MLIVISPAKNLNNNIDNPPKLHSIPDFLADAQLLVKDLQHLAPQDLAKLMGISDKLSVLNYDRYQQWHTPFTTDNALPALLTFNGEVYTGIDAQSFKAADYNFAQKHLRILSGLYGLLRPMDLIQPYRLEMGTRFKNCRGKDLYAFWDDRLTRTLNQQLKKLKSSTLINLASNEYFKAVQSQLLQGDIITPVFKDWKNDKYKVISFFAKKARGLMAAYIIKNRLTEPEDLKRFKEAGYRFSKPQSSSHEWVFTRQKEQ